MILPSGVLFDLDGVIIDSKENKEILELADNEEVANLD